MAHIKEITYGLGTTVKVRNYELQTKFIGKFEGIVDVNDIFKMNK